MSRKIKFIIMYSVNISGTFYGSYNTLGEAMECVEKNAKPYGLKWEILDSFGKIYAQG